MYAVAAAQPGCAARAALTASRASLRDALATFCPSASYVRPLSLRGNAPPMNSLYVFFTGASQSARIAREEIFGPVLTVMTFRTPDEAVEKANNTMYGLSAGVWTEKGSRILWMAQKLRAGVVWANTYNRFDPTSPFGGYRESGFGREGGRHGLEPYLRFDE